MEVLKQLALKIKSSLKKISNPKTISQYVEENKIASGFHYQISELITDTESVLAEDEVKPIWNGHLWEERKDQISILKKAFKGSHVQELGYDECYLLSICVVILNSAKTDRFFYSKYNAFVQRLRDIVNAVTPQQIHLNSQLNYIVLKKIHQIELAKQRIEFAHEKYVNKNQKELTEQLDKLLSQTDIENLKAKLVERYADELDDKKIQELIEGQQPSVTNEQYQELEKKLAEQTLVLSELENSYMSLSQLLNKVMEAAPEHTSLAAIFNVKPSTETEKQKKEEVSNAQIIANRGLGIIEKSIPQKLEETDDKTLQRNSSNEFFDVSLN